MASFNVSTTDFILIKLVINASFRVKIYAREIIFKHFEIQLLFWQKPPICFQTVNSVNHVLAKFVPNLYIWPTFYAQEIIFNLLNDTYVG